jgi:hypothetical protein
VTPVLGNGTTYRTDHDGGRRCALIPGAVTILHPRFENFRRVNENHVKATGSSTSVGIRATPNRRVYWSISSGTPANRVGLKEARTQIVDESQRCCNQSGSPRELSTTVRCRVISMSAVSLQLISPDHETHSRTKNGLRARTTGSV